MNTKHLIYALKDPRDGRVRYIGQSSRGLDRPRDHAARARLNHDAGKSHCYRWIRQLLSLGLQYEIEVVESFDESPDVKELLDTAEIRWIALYRQQELDLTNSSDGGGGRRGPRKTPVSEETRRRISEAKKGTPAWNKGKQLSAEYRKKLSENHRGMTGKKQTAETRAKISAALRRRVTSS